LSNRTLAVFPGKKTKKATGYQADGGW